MFSMLSSIFHHKSKMINSMFHNRPGLPEVVWCDVGVKADCLKKGLKPIGGMPSVGVFLRDPSPYLCLTSGTKRGGGNVLKQINTFFF